jgi:hypothetical protein
VSLIILLISPCRWMLETGYRYVVSSHGGFVCLNFELVGLGSRYRHRDLGCLFYLVFPFGMLDD